MSTETPGGIDRRHFLALGLGAFVVAAAPMAARRQPRVTRRTLPVMGTFAEIAVVDADGRRAHQAIDAAMAELLRVERTMTRFTRTSDIGMANLMASRAPVAVGAETAFVVAEALRWAEATGGAYDPAIGGAVALWDVAHRDTPPAAEQVRRLAARQLHRAVEVDRSGASPVLAYHNADVALDLGGIAKGYGVDRAVVALRAAGVTRALVNVGGDLYALGHVADGEPWRVGIQDPADPANTLETLRIADAAIATSGTYAQYFRHAGRRYHHLMDPATGAPRETLVRSLTIRADSCMHADVAATALYGMARADAARVLARQAPGGAVVHSA